MPDHSMPATPPGMTVRFATAADAALLAEHRAAVWHEVGEWSIEDLTPQIPIWTAFFREHVAARTYIACIAEDGGQVLGSGAVLVHLAIPRPESASARSGRVQSVYVVPGARRRGVARTIVERLIAAARDERLISLVLHPSSEGRPLYATLGFVDADEMSLRLT